MKHEIFQHRDGKKEICPLAVMDAAIERQIPSQRPIPELVKEIVEAAEWLLERDLEVSP